MATPDNLVAQHGEDVTLNRVTDAVFDDLDGFDEDESTTEDVTVKAIVSQPEVGETVSIAGDQVEARFHITVPSDTDIRADRAGRPDRVTVRGELCEVAQVRDDTHPFTGTRKLSATLVPLPGRS